MGKKKQFPIAHRSTGETEALERWAADEFRSVNPQIEYLLRDALRRANRWKEDQESESSQDDLRDGTHPLNFYPKTGTMVDVTSGRWAVEKGEVECIIGKCCGFCSFRCCF